MPATGTRASTLIDQLLQWLTSLANKGVRLDEYDMFRLAAGTTPALSRRVSDALKANGAPPLATLKRDQYYALTTTQFEAALAELLADLGLSLEAAKKLFCVKLDWCKRRKDWKGLAGRILAKVPRRWRGLVKFAGMAAPYIWDLITILLKLNPATELTLLGIHVSALLASGALDKLCGCPQGR